MDTQITTTTQASPLATSTTTTLPAAPGQTTKPKSTRRNLFRLQAKNFILTFPQCSVSKEDALERLTSSNLPLQGVIVCQEKHADEELHLHIGIFLTERFRTRDPNYFDFVAGKHGNYQPMKSIKGSIAYLKKEDPQPLTYGTIPSSSKDGKMSKSDTVAEQIASGTSIDDIATTFPGFFLLNKRKVEEIHCLIIHQFVSPLFHCQYCHPYELSELVSPILLIAYN